LCLQLTCCSSGHVVVVAAAVVVLHPLTLSALSVKMAELFPVMRSAEAVLSMTPVSAFEGANVVHRKDVFAQLLQFALANDVPHASVDGGDASARDDDTCTFVANDLSE
jgi:hypothetical protein